ncbi:hypothetical protein [Mycoplana ramosa]|uniref:Uncharacterized protein n=1 Tax=Mycoplana ramosa TaxID=40837 RepID=A0ABW3YUK0_MYCRA
MDKFTIGDLVPSGSLLWEDTPTHTVWLTRDGDKLHITTVQKVQAIIDANAQEAAEFNQTGSHGNLVKVASIPTSLYFAWQREGITEDPNAMKKRLNNGDLAKFRTNNWRL